MDRLDRHVRRVSYFLGAEIADHIGSAGPKAILGVAVVVAAGLAIRALVAKWRASRQTQLAQQEAPVGQKSAAQGP